MIEVGKALVNKILEVRTFSNIVDKNIDETYFEGIWKDMFQFIRDHYVLYKEVPAKEVFKKKFPSFTLKIYDSNIEYAIDQVIKAKKNNIVSNGMIRVQRLLAESNVDGAIDSMRTTMTELMEKVNLGDLNLVSSESLDDRYSRHCLRKETEGMDGITTGFDFLDNITYGFHKEELIILVARQGVGKSFFALILSARQWNKGNKVLFLTREMSENRIADRFDAIVGKMGYSDFRKGLVDKSYYLDKLGEISGGTDYIVSQVHGGVSSIAAKIQQYEPDIVYIDGVYLLEDERRASAKWERVTNITRDLKNLAQNYKIPIVGTTQLNRNASEGNIDLSHISYSDSVGQDADIVIGLYDTAEMREIKEKGVKMLKVRDGELKEGRMYWDLDKMEFEFIKEEIEDVPF